MPCHAFLSPSRLYHRVAPLVACLIALGGVASSVAAQATPGAAGGNATGNAMGGDSASSTGRNADPGARMMAALFRGITMTDAQKKSADSIHAAYQWQIAKVSTTTPWLARRALRQKEMGDLRAVLASDQQPTFDKNLDMIRSRMAGNQRGGGGPSTPQ